MVTVKQQGGRTDYNFMELYCDTKADLDSIDLENDTKFKNICAGSVAFVINTGIVYILNSQKEWIAQ